MTQAREMLAQAADELGYAQDAQVLRSGRGAFIQVNAALRAIDTAIAKAAEHISAEHNDA